MRIINTREIKQAIIAVIDNINVNISDDVTTALRLAEENEQCKLAKFALNMMNKNINIAKSTSSPVCQDTGMCVVFVAIGQQVCIEGGSLTDAINDAVATSYLSLRKSVLTPIERVNTGNNSPAVIHYDVIDGEKIKIDIMLKGFGSENMSKIYMLTPSQGVDGIIESIVNTAKIADSNPCPPIILGVGIGGTMEKAAILSKQALLRPINTVNPIGYLAEIEQKCLENINALGIGAQGFGGKYTALAVNILEYPTHIAGLPVAVTVQCHCSRHSTILI